MNIIDQIYINGQFQTPHGAEILELINPSTGQPMARVRLADEHDARAAIAAAKAAYPAFSRTTREQRMDYLQRLHDAVAARFDELVEVMMAEYGGVRTTCEGTARRAASGFLLIKEMLRDFEFVSHIGKATIVLEPLGVAGLITPWNANYSFICGKLGMALAAGSTVVIKPSELSAAQTRLLSDCLHAAGLPPGVINVVTGRGETVGAEITRHPDIAKISFTGSTVVGKAIARAAVDTMKRVTLELGGKSPNLLLDDADFDAAIPLALRLASVNSGQACMAGTRLLVPAHRLEEVKQRIRRAMADFKVGPPDAADSAIGPMVSQAQYARVQGYIRLGIEEGAELVTGGLGAPDGLEQGYFSRFTVFAGAPGMRIAREEIFGPVLVILSYETEEEAIALANDTVYGLHAFVSSSDLARAQRVAAQIVAGRVFINGLYDIPEVPFGGFKQSGIGREFGVHGLRAYLEPKAIMGPN